MVAGWRWIGIAAGVGATSCTLLLGEDKPFHEVDGTGGGAAPATSSTGSGAGNTSSGAGSSTATAGSTTGASTGTGGSGSQTCQVLHDAQDCGATGRCTIVDESTGKLGCKPLAGAPLGKYDACTDDTRCPAGTWCDQRTSACAPFCATSSSCGSGHCVAASNGAESIPGVSVCTAHCDPETAIPCGSGATCAYDTTALDFDCFVSGGTPLNGSCQTSPDCAKGLVCGISGTTGTCLQWCKQNGECPAIDICDMFTPAFIYNGADYGYCGD